MARIPCSLGFAQPKLWIRGGNASAKAAAEPSVEHVSCDTKEGALVLRSLRAGKSNPNATSPKALKKSRNSGLGAVLPLQIESCKTVSKITRPVVFLCRFFNSMDNILLMYVGQHVCGHRQTHYNTTRDVETTSREIRGGDGTAISNSNQWWPVSGIAILSKGNFESTIVSNMA